MKRVYELKVAPEAEGKIRPSPHLAAASVLSICFSEVVKLDGLRVSLEVETEAGDPVVVLTCTIQKSSDDSRHWVAVPFTEKPQTETMPDEQREGFSPKAWNRE